MFWIVFRVILTVFLVFPFVGQIVEDLKSWYQNNEIDEKLY